MAPDVQVRHPEVTVNLSQSDGNAFAVLGRVRMALHEAGCPREEVQRFITEATAGDSGNLISVVSAWVHVT